MGDEGVRDAHVWWSYVWHEMKRQSISNPQGTAGDIGGFGPQIDSHREGQAVVVSKQLRENLRALAIELTSIRQELLGRQLTFKREAEALKERVLQSERELGRVTSTARLHKEDKEMKIAEMAATIHMLTGKGDMFGQAAAARQDLLSERLAVHHLRDDVDSYRSMLDSEQIKVAALRKELHSMQGAAESLSVLNTLVDLPGVSAESLMEIMSGKIVTIEKDMNTAKAIAAQAQSESNQLRRQLAAAPSAPTGISLFSHGWIVLVIYCRAVLLYLYLLLFVC
jgi:chromosome segregation ATPase